MTRFPAKLLLFGEYSILLGSEAFSMPLNSLTASLEFIGHETGDVRSRAEKSNLQLKWMHDYFISQSPDFEAFLDLVSLGNDIRQGMYVASIIPQRYGMGSSGAVCAAVYSRYAISHNLVSLRDSFVKMESFFHGKSSGFDPLISYLQTPLLLGKQGDITAIDFTRRRMRGTGLEMLLADSGLPCSTGPLVENFLKVFSPGGMITSKGAVMCNLVNAAIDAFMGHDPAAFWSHMCKLSGFQLTELNDLVPAALRPVWADGLHSGLFAMKLCGSGGGGFLQCFTFRKEQTAGYLHDRNIPVIAVPFASS